MIVVVIAIIVILILLSVIIWSIVSVGGLTPALQVQPTDTTLNSAPTDTSIDINSLLALLLNTGLESGSGSGSGSGNLQNINPSIDINSVLAFNIDPSIDINSLLASLLNTNSNNSGSSSNLNQANASPSNLNQASASPRFNQASASLSNLNQANVSPRLNQASASPFNLNQASASPRFNQASASPRFNQASASPRFNQASASPFNLNQANASPFNLNQANASPFNQANASPFNFNQANASSNIIIDTSSSPIIINYIVYSKYIKGLTGSGISDVRIQKITSGELLTIVTTTQLPHGYTERFSNNTAVYVYDGLRLISIDPNNIILTNDVLVRCDAFSKILISDASAAASASYNISNIDISNMPGVQGGSSSFMPNMPGVQGGSSSFMPSVPGVQGGSSSFIQGIPSIPGVQGGSSSFIPGFASKLPNANASASIINQLISQNNGSASSALQVFAKSSITSKKKGFVVGNEDPVGGLKVNSLNTGWYYTWGPTQSMSPVPAGINFTPMIWSLDAAFTPAKITTLLNNIKSLPISATDNYLLTYNEPDGVNAGAQANMTVGVALQYWPTVLSAMISSYTTPPILGSPVMYGSTTQVPSDAPGTGKNINSMPQPSIVGSRTINISNKSVPNMVTLNPAIWIDNFLLQVYDTHQKTPYIRSPFPNFICIHWYGVPQVKSFTNYIAAVYDKYNLPIWVTEYSCADWNATCCPTAHPTQPNVDWSYPTDITVNLANASQSTNTTAQFMIQTMQWMDQQPYVERYTWKERPLLVPPNANITKTGTTPTSINVGGKSYPLDSSMSTMSADNQDFMGQSTLFNSYEHFPTTMPPLTPLGQLYAII